ncbi:TetR/AcrR family transcriptional regulator [Streptomyces europaeiscabiei]|uniref:TetR/AcrR family transcriptional regulator n=2 Tax=Streptomyces TaxID=1883 RepID=UPI0029A55C25|nr:TetR/AcrR family transcriptional regulator [Streptomyces europaeiscabiei]MDX3617833.1 TetR/AcrR family transcriptional regulator [Streptomyces europaeiscabiei]MDX3632054.1 TetR/AcrR family transcriptional regulator [Streptomyces europaeiscabiei]MDX3649852.1 TetR/AcrR family transcriptional regulator [Streptomyces europaeiscabiei]WUD36909.1 TetR/AcrR family transcriptional regulator [Streptomyces europaeiscabiei]
MKQEPTESTTPPPRMDRRVRRSRSALMRAAIALVTERGTTAVPVSEIAEAADVSRQVLYQQFGDRDGLLLRAALDLARRELIEGPAYDSADMTDRAGVLAMARHFAEHRGFYRAMFTGSCAFDLNRALTELIIPANREVVRHRHGTDLAPELVDDLATFLTGGASAVVNTWVVAGEEPLDPEEFTDRLMRMVPVVATALGRSTTPAPNQEQRR